MLRMVIYVCRTYVQIVSHEQRQRYKQDFNSEYNEYRMLYSEMSSRMQVFKRLKDQLSKESGETKEVTSEYWFIMSDYKKLECGNVVQCSG